MVKNNLPRPGTIWIHHATLNNIKVIGTGHEPFDYVSYIDWDEGKTGDRRYRVEQIHTTMTTVTLCEFLSSFVRNRTEEEN